MNLIKKPFYFMRHGQTDGNKNGIAQGQSEEPLNQTGINQACAAQKLLINCSIDVICYSPSLRAKQTAEIVNQTIKCKLIEVDDLRPCDWGPYQSKAVSSWLQEWAAGASLPGVESVDQLA